MDLLGEKSTTTKEQAIYLQKEARN